MEVMLYIYFIDCSAVHQGCVSNLRGVGLAFFVCSVCNYIDIYKAFNRSNQLMYSFIGIQRLVIWRIIGLFWKWWEENFFFLKSRQIMGINKWSLNALLNCIIHFHINEFHSILLADRNIGWMEIFFVDWDFKLRQQHKKKCRFV